MLEIKNLSIWLSINDKPVIENFSFTLNKGEKAVIIGEEGNGKSTLLKLIYDENLVNGYCRHQGQIKCFGKMGYLPQFIDEKYLDMTLSEYFHTLISECENTEYGYNYVESTLYSILENLSLPDDIINSDQLIKTLSGGEKVKILLASILLKEPEILLFDEPTNDLDIETLIFIEDFINSSPLPILYISHDETLIENTADTIIHIEQLIRKTRCRVTVSGQGYREYIKSRGLLFDRQMQIARKQRSDYASKMDRWQQIYNKVEKAQANISRGNPSGGRLLKKKMKSVKAQERRLENEAENFTEIPEVEDAIITRFDDDIKIPNGKVILDFSGAVKANGRTLSENVSLKIVGSEHIGIIGNNGVGKSTFLKMIWEILSQRKDITACYMPQNYEDKLDFNISPIEFLAPGGDKETVTRARTLMGNMRFTHEEMTGKIRKLSGGQKAKILFLDMVLKKADVLILDEPTRNFSPVSSPVVRSALMSFGGTIISISHDRKYLDEVCDKVYMLTKQALELVLKD